MRRLLIPLVLVALIAAACGDDATDVGQAPTPTDVTTTVPGTDPGASTTTASSHARKTASRASA